MRDEWVAMQDKHNFDYAVGYSCEMNGAWKDVCEWLGYTGELRDNDYCCGLGNGEVASRIASEAAARGYEFK